MNELAAGRWPGSLVSADRARDHEFEVLLAEASTLAFRVAYAVLRSREDAEDVAQDAAVRAYRRFGSLRDRESFRPWLVRIAWRLALDRRRTERRRERREQSVFGDRSPALTVEEMAASRQLEETVWKAVDALPEKLRAVVVLGAIEGHGTRDVAGLLGLPEGTIKSRLHAARRRLLEELKWVVTGTKKS
jgi:RNA polymerase sigma-70 factor (ECF subfamily)